MSEAPGERRRMPRYPVSLVIEMELGKGTTRDISASGVYFETAELLAAGAPIRFTLVLEHADPSPLRVGYAGQVMRVEPRGTAFGVAAAITSHWIEPSSPGFANHARLEVPSC
jgi:hypothetical protein